MRWCQHWQYVRRANLLSGWCRHSANVLVVEPIGYTAKITIHRHSQWTMTASTIRALIVEPPGYTVLSKTSWQCRHSQYVLLRDEMMGDGRWSFVVCCYFLTVTVLDGIGYRVEFGWCPMRMFLTSINDCLDVKNRIIKVSYLLFEVWYTILNYVYDLQPTWIKFTVWGLGWTGCSH